MYDSLYGNAKYRRLMSITDEYIFLSEVDTALDNEDEVDQFIHDAAFSEKLTKVLKSNSPGVIQYHKEREELNTHYLVEGQINFSSTLLKASLEELKILMKECQDNYNYSIQYVTDITNLKQRESFGLDIAEEKIKAIKEIAKKKFDANL